MTLRSALRGKATGSHPALRLVRRALGRALELTDWTVRARLDDGSVLHVELSNSVGRTIWLRHEYLAERSLVAVMRTTLRPGDVFIDVGANVGYFTLLGSRLVGPEGRVHAFEPAPRVAALLRRNVEANGLRNVVVVEAALGAGTGAAAIAATRDSAYTYMLPDAAGPDTGRGVQVRTLTLDDHRRDARGRPPRLVKMDIQGFEPFALAGGERTLSGPDGPDVICEVAGWHLARYGNRPEDVFALLRGWSYEAVNPETMGPMDVSDLTPRQENVLFRKRREA